MKKVKISVQIYYVYNSYWDTYLIFVENVAYQNHLLINEVKQERQAQILCGGTREWEKRNIGMKYKLI